MCLSINRYSYDLYGTIPYTNINTFILVPMQINEKASILMQHIFKIRVQ